MSTPSPILAVAIKNPDFGSLAQMVQLCDHLCMDTTSPVKVDGVDDTITVSTYVGNVVFPEKRT